jgi:hypothetical protein
MDLGTVERVATNEPLAAALSTAFSRLRGAATSRCALAFDPKWQPTMDVVDLITNELTESEDITNLILVHPSSAMTFIASALGLRTPAVQITAQRSIYDELEDDSADATASKTMFVMAPTERVEHFVRRAVREAQDRAVRRFALIFDASAVPSMDVADALAQELLRSGTVREIGLIHPKASLETLVAALRLRLPSIRIAHANATKAVR